MATGFDPRVIRRPAPEKMQPFEWIYWALLDKGEDALAEAVRLLISDRVFAMQDRDYHASRQLEMMHQARKA
jgi:hypothetical protein